MDSPRYRAVVRWASGSGTGPKRRARSYVLVPTHGSGGVVYARDRTPGRGGGASNPEVWNHTTGSESILRTCDDRVLGSECGASFPRSLRRPGAIGGFSG